MTRELVQNGYKLRKYGIDFQYKRVHGGRKIILHYDYERDGSDSKTAAELLSRKGASRCHKRLYSVVSRP